MYATDGGGGERLFSNFTGYILVRPFQLNSYFSMEITSVPPVSDYQCIRIYICNIWK